MVNFAKMIKAMITGLFHRKDFDSSEDFWNWYWTQIPDERYFCQTLKGTLDTFLWTITLRGLRADIADNWNLKFSKHYPGYSPTFKKQGCFFKSRDLWLFTPDDKSFTYGVPSYEDIVFLGLT